MSDTEIWKLLKSGDHTALKEIYEAHIDFLLAYGLRFGRDPSVVEDCVHDLFVYIWQNRKTVGVTDNIRPYLTIALRRRILKSIKNSSITSKSGDESDFRFHAEPSIDEKIIFDENNAEKRSQLTKAMADLSDREKEVLYLKYQHQMSYENICKVMDINNQSARNLVSRAVKKLRALLEFTIGLIFLLFN